MKTKLSTNVLQMKFMKRAAVERQEELALEEQQKQIDDEHWYLNIGKEKKIESNVSSVIVESSYSIFDCIGFGRMSFNGFNPQIEKLMKSSNEKENKNSDSNDKEIEDEEMAEHFSNSCEKTVNNKKFGVKRFFKKPKVSKAKRVAT